MIIIPRLCVSLFFLSLYLRKAKLMKGWAHRTHWWIYRTDKLLFYGSFDKLQKKLNRELKIKRKRIFQYYHAFSLCYTQHVDDGLKKGCKKVEKIAFDETESDLHYSWLIKALSGNFFSFTYCWCVQSMELMSCWVRDLKI